MRWDKAIPEFGPCLKKNPKPAPEPFRLLLNPSYNGRRRRVPEYTHPIAIPCWVLPLIPNPY